MTKRLINAIITILLLLIFYKIRSCNKYNDVLTGVNQKFTFANVYDSYSVKGSTYYKYIYKVNSNYYTCDTPGKNVEDLSNNKIQSFLVVYSKNNPKIHLVIWDEKFDFIKMLGIDTNVSSEKNNELVDKNLNNGITPFADENDKKEIMHYESKIN